MNNQTIIIFGCSLISCAMCITCYVIISAKRQLNKYSVRPLEDEYPA